MQSMLRGLRLGMLVVGVFATRASALTYTVDQEATPALDAPYFYGGVGTGTSVGQEFVPQQASLDVVELWFETDSKTCYPYASIVVVIRDQALTGAILGTSNATTVGCFHGALEFDFPSSVTLTPGHTYVIEPIADDFNYWYMTINGGLDVYAPGHAVMYGDQYSEHDFWFREGPATPVATVPTTWGSIKALYR
jgi:hypothetical protein